MHGSEYHHLNRPVTPGSMGLTGIEGPGDILCYKTMIRAIKETFI